MFVVYVGVGDVCVQLAGPSCSVVKQTLRRPYIPDGWLFLAPYDVMCHWRRRSCGGRPRREIEGVIIVDRACVTPAAGWDRPVLPVLRPTAQYRAGGRRPQRRRSKTKKRAARHASAFNLATAALSACSRLKSKRSPDRADLRPTSPCSACYLAAAVHGGSNSGRAAPRDLRQHDGRSSLRSVGGRRPVAWQHGWFCDRAISGVSGRNAGKGQRRACVWARMLRRLLRNDPNAANAGREYAEPEISRISARAGNC